VADNLRDVSAGGATPEVSTEDLVLAIAAGADGPYDLDPIRLMKACFLVSQRGRPAWKVAFRFRPYDYGPFDRGVYAARDALLAHGLLQADSNGRRYPSYSLTEAGRARAAELKDVLGDDGLSWLARIGRYVTSKTFSRLLDEVYAAYPDFAVKSIAR